mgnify:FL=1
MEALPAIRAAGAGLLIVLPVAADRAAAWQRDHGATEALVAADPDYALYRALGIGRGSARALLLDPASWRDALAELAHGRPARKHRDDDGWLLGADLAIAADGRIAHLHRARTAADRLPAADLLARLRRG